MLLRSAALVCALFGIATASAQAATIDVTTTSDVIANDGSCSLREAFISANTDTPSGTALGECPAGSPGGNEIVVRAMMYALTLVPPPGGDQSNTGGALDVTSDITLAGQGVGQTTINGDALDRVLDVSQSGTLIAHDLSVIGGVAPSGTNATGTARGGPGGGGGGIRSAGILSLDHVMVAGNKAGAGGNGIAGTAPGDAAGSGGNGGGVESTGASLTILDSTIADNQAGIGGGAGGGSLAGGPGGQGGGIDASRGLITIVGSTISGNQGGGGGFGGTFGGPAGNGGGLSLISTTVGTLTNDTIADNDAGHLGFGIMTPPTATSDGGAMTESGPLLVTSVTVSRNSEQNEFNCCHDIVGTSGMRIRDSALDATCSSGIANGGANVALANGGCPGLPVNARSGSGVFDLGPLRNNGGSTETMLPGPRSALADEVPVTGAGCPPTDQRGVSRPQGRACDAGSVEVRPFRVGLRPARLKFGRLAIGQLRRKSVRVTFANGERSTLSLGRARVTGRNARDFRVVANRCRRKSLATSQSCTVVISFRPRRKGLRTAKVTIVGLPKTIPLVGTGVPG